MFQRNRKRDSRAFAFTAGELNLAAVTFDDGFADVEPQPCALDLGVAGVGGSVKSLKKVGDLCPVAWNSRS
jgi:hypothetical protein